MSPLPSGTKIWLVDGITDMRNSFNCLATKVQTALKDDPMSGHVFIFRGPQRQPSQIAVVHRRRTVPADETPGAQTLRLVLGP